ncbi:MAG: alpha/beta fold hydrolase, partial [Bryobacteraceae bacterium]|nr:alpha/beta fold hydrolase [Bryobacteraceae bacterium]
PQDYPDKQNLLYYLDAAGQRHPVRTPADWARRRNHILQRLQLVMGPLPRRPRQRPQHSMHEVERAPTFTRFRLDFQGEPGDNVPAWLFLPNSRGKHPAMLCLHQTTAIGKDEPAGLGGKPNLRYAVELAARGFVTLAPDYPNFGGYKIDVYARGYASATMKGILNHMRAVDLLSSLTSVDRKRIGVCGHSLGGHNALFLAAFDERIQATVTSCGFTAMPKYFNGNLTGWSHKGYMPRIAERYGASPARLPFDFPEILGAIAPRAIFINAPKSDSNFDVAGVADCVREAALVFDGIFHAKDMLQVRYPDAGHDFPPDVRQEAYRFVESVLKHQPPSPSTSGKA